MILVPTPETLDAGIPREFFRGTCKVGLEIDEVGDMVLVCGIGF